MIDIIYIDIISIVSLIYSLLIMFIPFAPIDQIFLVYIWTIAVSVIVAINEYKSRLYYLILIFLLLPIIFYNDIRSIVFILITSITLSLYIKTSLTITNHDVYVNRLKIASIVYVVLIYLRSVINEFELFLGEETNFFILYLLFSIVLIRSIRHLNGNIEVKKLRKNNVVFLVTSFILLLIVKYDGFKKTLSDILGKVIEIIYYPLYLIGYPIGKLIDFITNMESKGEKDLYVPDKLLGSFEATEEITEGGIVINDPYNFKAFKVIIGLALVLLSIYLIYKLIAKFGNTEYIGLEYTEEREYIKDKERKEKKKIFNIDRYPRDLRGQIRYYYRKYLEKLKKQDLVIENSDTSLEINHKAQIIYKNNIEKIREIYIESRYGDKEVDNSTVEEIEELYKNL